MSQPKGCCMHTEPDHPLLLSSYFSFKRNIERFYSETAFPCLGTLEKAVCSFEMQDCGCKTIFLFYLDLCGDFLKVELGIRDRAVQLQLLKSRLSDAQK